MSLLTVVQDVCAAVGVDRPTSVFSNINYNRTMTEMLALANEMAQRIAYDTRDWTVLITGTFFNGDGVTEAFSLPANFKRLLLTSELWRSTSNLYPMRFIADQNMWTQRRLWGYADQRGEWIIFGGQIHIQPIMTGPPPPSPAPANWVGGTLYPIDALARDTDGYTIWKCLISHTPPVSGQTFTQNRTANPTFWLQIIDPNPLPWAYTTWYSVGARARDVADNTIWSCLIRHLTPASGTFAANRATNPGFWSPVTVTTVPLTRTAMVYLDKNCINLASGGVGDTFINDGDSFRLNERLLKLGMIWQWKALKGSPYAEDLGTYNDALDRVAGADKPASIMVGRLPISAAARVGYPFPIDPGMVPL
jgi:hypothetical protein